MVSARSVATIGADCYEYVECKSTYSGGYQTGVILKTRCGLEINSCRLCIGEQLLRSPSGTLYVSSQIPQDSWCCGHPSSTPGCNSCGRQGVVEPLSNILGTLGREQRTARWAVVLVLQIMEVRLANRHCQIHHSVPSTTRDSRIDDSASSVHMRHLLADSGH